MDKGELSAVLTVAQVMAQWPQTVPVFIRRRMACAGCDIAPFETLAEAADIYHIELAAFLNDLGEAISTPAEGKSA